MAYSSLRSIVARAFGALTLAPALGLADGGPACARAGNSLSCWGGELVVRDASLDHPALLAKVPQNARATVFRHRNACTVLEGGALACWGDNEQGQLGDGTTKARTGPMPVSGAGRVTQVAVGWTHACALRTDARVLCWGGMRPTPLLVNLPADVVEISAGGFHSCARRRGGSVWCWGSGGYGQLGDGARADRPRPVRVRGIDDAQSLAAGLYHTCVVRADHTAWCWGNGAGGEDGVATRWRVPSKVPGGDEVLEVAAGDYGLAVRRQGKPPLACDYQVKPQSSEDDPILRCRPVAKLVIPEANNVAGAATNLRVVDAVTVVH